MPKLKKHDFYVRHPKSDEVYEYSADVSVSSDGEFMIHLDEDIAVLAKPLSGNRDDITVWKSTRGLKKWHVHSRNLETAIRFVDKVLLQYLEPEIEVEYFIVYKYTSDGDYYQDSGDGSLHPSGCYEKTNSEMAGTGTWANEWASLGMGKADMFLVGFGAHLLKRTTCTRGEMVEVKYEKDGGSHRNPNIGEWGNRLCTYYGIDYKVDKGTKLIPYTEDAAEFFCKMNNSIIEMIHRFNGFFADENNIKTAIQTKRQIFAINIDDNAKGDVSGVDNNG